MMRSWSAEVATRGDNLPACQLPALSANGGAGPDKFHRDRRKVRSLMLSLADVRQWKPAELDGVFATLGAHRDALVTLDDDLAATRNPAGWTGRRAG